MGQVLTVNSSVANNPINPEKSSEHVAFLNGLLEDDSVAEIMINRFDRVFVEKNGVLHQLPYSLESREYLDLLASQLIKMCGMLVTHESQSLDGMLPDGSRVTVVLPPASVEGSAISIRKMGKAMRSFDEMVKSGILPVSMTDFLKALAKARVSILISGSASSGKTTLLNALSAHIGAYERIVTIEDAAELNLQHCNVVRLESNADKGTTQRELLRSALRLRADRIIMGELRGDEALDFMQAINSGHDGSMSTIHANNPRDALMRLEMMINMSGVNLSQKFIQQQTASSLNIIIHVKRGEDGKRFITNISEIVGREADMIVLHDFFVMSVDPKTGKNTYKFNSFGSRNPKIRKALIEANLLT